LLKAEHLLDSGNRVIAVAGQLVVAQLNQVGIGSLTLKNG
jgi:hypothetical protein